MALWWNDADKTNGSALRDTFLPLGQAQIVGIGLESKIGLLCKRPAGTNRLNHNMAFV